MGIPIIAIKQEKNRWRQGAYTWLSWNGANPPANRCANLCIDKSGIDCRRVVDINPLAAGVHCRVLFGKQRGEHVWVATNNWTIHILVPHLFNCSCLQNSSHISINQKWYWTIHIRKTEQSSQNFCISGLTKIKIQLPNNRSCYSII